VNTSNHPESATVPAEVAPGDVVHIVADRDGVTIARRGFDPVLTASRSGAYELAHAVTRALARTETDEETTLAGMTEAEWPRLDAIAEAFSVGYSSGWRDATHPEAAGARLADELTAVAREARRLSAEGASAEERAEHDRRKRRVLAMVDARDAERGD
jgi:hypothetical protein